jgi:hypothetical protein
MASGIAVVAFGGNSLIVDPEHESIPDQAAAATAHHIGAGRGRLERGDHPRQRPAGGVHPAALGIALPLGNLYYAFLA